MLLDIFLITAVTSISGFILWTLILKPVLEEKQLWKKEKSNGKKRK
tara:strand:+ start:1970 stop:2107 length:138 start_codon:yes stop_codon:yes gene_type:complete